VRDQIPHSFDVNAGVVAAKASDVLRYRTGVCHAKANLLAALLRSQGIPAGFRFQRLTLAGDDSKGYVVHCCSAIFLGGKWVTVDARGNKPEIDAQFSLDEPVLAYPCRSEYDEYFWEGVYAEPNLETMCVLEAAKSLEDIYGSLPDHIEGAK